MAKKKDSLEKRRRAEAVEAWNRRIAVESTAHIEAEEVLALIHEGNYNLNRTTSVILPELIAVLITLERKVYDLEARIAS